jgi:chromosome segregation ATPase
MNMAITITTHPHLAQFEESLRTIQREQERADLARIESARVARAAATTPIEHMEADLAALEAQAAEERVFAQRESDLEAAELARIDAELEPLQAECLRRTQGHDFGERAETLRNRRHVLQQERAAVGQAMRDICRRGAGGSFTSVHEMIVNARQKLEDARKEAAFDALTEADLTKAVKGARFKVDAASDEARGAQDSIEHYRAKLAEAHQTIAEETEQADALAELIAKREKLQGDAFITGKAPDPAKLAELGKAIAREEKSLEQARQKAAGARAAIATLEAKIEELEAQPEEVRERVAPAEAALQAALADLERRLMANAEAEHRSRMQAIRQQLQSFLPSASAPMLPATVIIEAGVFKAVAGQPAEEMADESL